MCRRRLIETVKFCIEAPDTEAVLEGIRYCFRILPAVNGAVVFVRSIEDIILRAEALHSCLRPPGWQWSLRIKSYIDRKSL